MLHIIYVMCSVQYILPGLDGYIEAPVAGCLKK